MATAVVMPKQGNTVESCIITSWKKNVGDVVNTGDVLCEVETDKAVLAVESPTNGVMLARYFGEGDDVPVLTNIAVIGEAGEDISAFSTDSAPAQNTAQNAAQSAAQSAAQAIDTAALISEIANTDAQSALSERDAVFISPRAKNLALAKGLDYSALKGTGPDGRIIERDILAALDHLPAMTRGAQAVMPQPTPQTGSGIGGRVTTRDLTTHDLARQPAALQPDSVTEIPLKGVRKVIADRMRGSLQNSAQLTLNAYADARALLAYRQRLKASGDGLGLNSVTINDLILFAVSRVLLDYPEINATLTNDIIRQYRDVHPGFAVDTPRGLLVPVLHRANHMSLKTLSAETSRLAQAAQNGTLTPDEMNGGTFTVSNLGALGVDTFTPVINPPQVAILGVGGVSLRPVESGDDVQFIKHLALSLTVDHQVVDGAPGARFLSALCHALADIDLLIAL